MININKIKRCFYLIIESDECLCQECGENTHQYGRSMIEMLGVLAIIGILSVSGITGYSKAMMKFKTNKTIEQITHISQNIRTLYANQKYYDFNSVTKLDIMKNTGLIPDDMIHEENGIDDDDLGFTHYIYNPFGGGVFITGDDWNCAFDNDECEYKAFTITYFRLPKEACVQLAMMDWNNLEGIHFFEISKYDSIDVQGSLNVTNRNKSIEGDVFYYTTNLPIYIPASAISNSCDCTDNECSVVLGFLD